MAKLNKDQAAAVQFFDAPLCILAGAGTGKTRVITHRIAELIKKRSANPSKILALTFTNKAAGVMRERLEDLIPECYWKVRLGTFHAMAAKFLRHNGYLINISSDFVIYDQSDSERLYKQIAKDEFSIDKEELPLYIKQIDAWQNEGKTPEEIIPDSSHAMRISHGLYEKYLQALNKQSALDFNGLLIAWYKLLTHPEGSKLFAEEVQHLMVDEFQDTNLVQAAIVHKMAELVESIAVVGDDDQTIYGWRGASATNMQIYLKQLNAKLIRLEQNYRSTDNILKVANEVIQNNTGRIGKQLVALAKAERAVEANELLNDLEEAQEVIRIVRNELSQGTPLKEIAILMRTNAQSRLFEEALRRNRIDYQLIGGTKFYDRKVVKDALSFLRLALNPKSNMDALRVLNAKTWGIGAQSIVKISALADLNAMTFFETMKSPLLVGSGKIPKRTMSKISHFVSVIESIQDAVLDNADAAASVAAAITLSGLREYYTEKFPDEAEEKIDLLEQACQSAVNFEDLAEKYELPNTATAFLEEASLMSSTETLNESEGVLSLMTMHASKGLEFDTVVMVGMEERTFPHARALDSGKPGDIEEERRLAYVGITRARKKLVLTFARRRMFQGTVQRRMPSRFLREIPPKLLQKPIRFSEVTSNSFQQQAFRTPFSSAIPASTVQFVPDDPSGFSPGDVVEHRLFGRGRILALKGGGQYCRAQILFERDDQKRTIMTQYLSE